MKLFIVAVLKGEPTPNIDHHPWMFVGMYDNEELAVAACTTKKHFVQGPYTLNHTMLPEPSQFKHNWFPTVESKEEGTARVRKIYKDRPIECEEDD